MLLESDCSVTFHLLEDYILGMPGRTKLSVIRDTNTSTWEATTLKMTGVSDTAKDWDPKRAHQVVSLPQNSLDLFTSPELGKKTDRHSFSRLRRW